MWSNTISRALKNGTLRKTLRQFLIKHTLIVWSSNCTLCYLPKWGENFVHTNICTKVCIAALFLKLGNNPRCLLVDEWANKPCYIQTIEYYSELKRNEGSAWVAQLVKHPTQFGLRSWSCGLWVRALYWALCWQGRDCLGFPLSHLSLSLPCLLSLSLWLSKNKYIN